MILGGLEIRIVHVINGLERGGAEATLFRLISEDKSQEHFVICLTSLGPIGRTLIDEGKSVVAIGMTRSPLVFFRGFRKIVSILRQEKPSVVQTWLYKADLIGSLAALIAGNIKLAWNVRSSPPIMPYTSVETFVAFSFLAIMSWWVPDKIVACGDSVVKSHVRRGYRSDKFEVIPNGLKENDWVPNEQPRLELGNQLGISKEALVYGQLANYSKIKRHNMLIEAFSAVIAANSNAHLVLAGKNVDSQNQALRMQIEQLGLEGHVHLLGYQAEPRWVLQAIDVLVSPSAQEGFPNVILESMFLGKMVIVSNAGESANIVGSDGLVFQPDSAAGLANFLILVANLNSEQRETRGLRLRKRAHDNYSEMKMRNSYVRVWSLL